jgi:uncharacterized SAM-binding protein YcdF (DUF218 family)
LTCGAIGGIALLAGFAVFAQAVRRAPPESLPDADAIVVLTGGEDRIEVGIKLLSEGKGRRLLISGVNPTTRVAEIRRLGGHDNRLFRCCIDFGYEAVDTSSNAEEARAWASDKGYARLILVTSSYHMPRSLTEFARVLPETELVAYPVATRHYQLDGWWHHRPTARLLAAEYVKFLTSATRLGVSRLYGVLERRTVAGSPPHANKI